MKKSQLIYLLIALSLFSITLKAQEKECEDKGNIYTEVINNSSIIITVCAMKEPFGGQLQITPIIKNKTDKILKIDFEWQIMLTNGRTIKKSCTQGITEPPLILKPRQTIGGRGYLADLDGVTIMLFANKDCIDCKTMTISQIKIIGLTVGVASESKSDKENQIDKSINENSPKSTNNSRNSSGNFNNSPNENIESHSSNSRGNQSANETSKNAENEKSENLNTYNIKNQAIQDQYNDNLAELSAYQASSIVGLAAVLFRNIGNDNVANIPKTGGLRASIGLGFGLQGLPLVKNTETEFYTGTNYNYDEISENIELINFLIGSDISLYPYYGKYFGFALTAKPNVGALYITGLSLGYSVSGGGLVYLGTKSIRVEGSYNVGVRGYYYDSINTFEDGQSLISVNSQNNFEQLSIGINILFPSYYRGKTESQISITYLQDRILSMDKAADDPSSSFIIGGEKGRGVKVALSYNNRIEFYAECYPKYPRMGSIMHKSSADKSGTLFQIGIYRMLDFYKAKYSQHYFNNT